MSSGSPCTETSNEVRPCYTPACDKPSTTEINGRHYCKSCAVIVQMIVDGKYLTSLKKGKK